MSVRVYTNLTPGQFEALEKIAAADDRSISWLIARAIDNHIADATPCTTTPKEATKKVFTRTTSEAAEKVKAAASRLECEEWRLTNSAIVALIESRP